MKERFEVLNSAVYLSGKLVNQDEALIDTLKSNQSIHGYLGIGPAGASKTTFLRQSITALYESLNPNEKLFATFIEYDPYTEAQEIEFAIPRRYWSEEELKKSSDDLYEDAENILDRIMHLSYRGLFLSDLPSTGSLNRGKTTTARLAERDDVLIHYFIAHPSIRRRAAHFREQWRRAKTQQEKMLILQKYRIELDTKNVESLPHIAAGKGGIEMIRKEEYNEARKLERRGLIDKDSVNIPDVIQISSRFRNDYRRRIARAEYHLREELHLPENRGQVILVPYLEQKTIHLYQEALNRTDQAA